LIEKVCVFDQPLLFAPLNVTFHVPTLCPEPVGLMVGVEVAVIVSVVGAAAGLGFVAMAFTLNAGVNVPSVTVDADVFHVGVTATVPIAPAVL
jgi:hypothetical protein